MARLALAVLGAVLLAHGAAAAAPTCQDKQNAGQTCIVPYTFPNGTKVCGQTLPSYWSGPAPICFTQYDHNQCVPGGAARGAHGGPR